MSSVDHVLQIGRHLLPVDQTAHGVAPANGLAQRDLILDHSCQHEQLLTLGGCQYARLHVDDAQRAQDKARRQTQWHTRIKAHERRPGHQRVISKSMIAREVVHFENLGLPHGIRADGGLARSRVGVESHPGQKLLPIAIHQGNQYGGNLKQIGGQTRELIEIL
ncbi:hypothetical protein RBI22_04785 [Alcaligenaceae bacterium C4P045]|nr:hypothetical protein [Alcaligenaceae bacterium C4P045]